MSAYCYVEASLTFFVFDIAAIGFLHIVEHLGEYPFEGVVGYCSSAFSWWSDYAVAVVGYVECCGVLMAGVWCGVGVVLL